jgi:LacI family transcriptional regulator, galactose operon repressor
LSKGIIKVYDYMDEYTIRDIAELAQVSLATVSRAINRPKDLKPETLRRVSDVITRVGYRPNRIASSLKSRKTHTVGVIVSDILNPFFVGIVKSAERRFSAADYTAIICDSEENPERELHYLNELLARRIDGLVMIPALEHNVLPRVLKQLNVPAVFVDRSLSSEHDCIKTDNHSGISLLVNHLVARGYRRIAFVCGPAATLPGRERFESFKTELALHNLAFNADLVSFCDFSVMGGYESTKELLGRNPRPQAIIASNNLTGMGALKAITDSSLAIPDDIALVVFDDFLMSDLTNPPLTVVAQPADLIGEEAANILIRRMMTGDHISPQLILHTPKLVVRKSTRILDAGLRPQQP